METLTQFLEKLSRLDLVSTDGTKKMISVNSFEVSYSVKMNSLMGADDNLYFPGGMPFSAVISVVRDGKLVASWGCVDQQENDEFAMWWATTYKEVEKYEYNEEKNQSLINKRIWDNI